VCVVAFVLLGLALVGVFIATAVAMNRYGSNK